MKGFAKVVQLDTHDVVMVLNSNEKNGEHIQVFIRDEEMGCTLEPILGYDTEEEAKEAFESMDKEKVAKIVIEMLGNIREMFYSSKEKIKSYKES